MKKVVLLLLIAGWHNVYAQPVKETPIASDAVYAKCVSAVKDYLGQTIDQRMLDKYFEFEREYSKTIISHNLTIFDGRQPTNGELLGYTINFQIKPEFVDSYRGSIDFRLFVDTKMKVWFDKGWNSGSGLSFEENIAPRIGLQPQDRSDVYINSMKTYLVAFDTGKLLKNPQILATADKHSPGMKWRKPILSRDSFPPYNSYWEVIQDDCQEDCKVLHIKIDEPTVVKTSKVSFVGL